MYFYNITGKFLGMETEVEETNRVGGPVPDNLTNHSLQSTVGIFIPHITDAIRISAITDLSTWMYIQNFSAAIC